MKHLPGFDALKMMIQKPVYGSHIPGIPEIPPEPVQVKDDFVNQMIDPKDEELEEPIVSPTEEVNSAGETVMVGDTELTFEEDFSDFEDCLQDECAKQVFADYIITRNTDDFLTSEIPAISPADFLEEWKNMQKDN